VEVEEEEEIPLAKIRNDCEIVIGFFISHSIFIHNKSLFCASSLPARVNFTPFSLLFHLMMTMMMLVR
jgi:hypothetical protein